MDASANRVTHAIMEVVLRRYFEVVHNAAGFTNEMIVGLNERVIAAEALAKIEL